MSQLPRAKNSSSEGKLLVSPMSSSDISYSDELSTFSPKEFASTLADSNYKVIRFHLRDCFGLFDDSIQCH